MFRRLCSSHSCLSCSTCYLGPSSGVLPATSIDGIQMSSPSTTTRTQSSGGREYLFEAPRSSPAIREENRRESLPGIRHPAGPAGRDSGTPSRSTTPTVARNDVVDMFREQNTRLRVRERRVPPHAPDAPAVAATTDTATTVTTAATSLHNRDVSVSLSRVLALSVSTM